MDPKLLHYCPKCGCSKLDIEPEPGQYSLFCRGCNFYCEIVVFDEGDTGDDSPGGNP